MGRLSPELLTRVETFSDRTLDLVPHLEKSRCYRRVIDQMVGCGTSVGANTFEADQAVSAADFCKAIGIAVRELAETQFWIRTCARRSWVSQARIEDLEDEAVQLAKIFSTMITRTRRKRRAVAASA